MVDDQALMQVEDDGPSNAVVLHEDKSYYPTLSQVYGDGVETMVQEEDAQPLSQPIIAPVQQKKFTIQEVDLPRVHYSRDFQSDIMQYPENIRNISLCGHLHHGIVSCTIAPARCTDVFRRQNRFARFFGEGDS